MAKEIMERRASDNVYLHRDFHGALSTGIEYLHATFGPEAVRDYLREFALSYYAPLREALMTEGLPALKRHFERMYEIEGGDTSIALDGDELVVTVTSCPAVAHMRSHGYPVARLFRETTVTVNDAICEGTPYEAETTGYDDGTGACVQRFYRRRT